MANTPAVDVTTAEGPIVYVDVIIPVHNAAETVVDAVKSAMHQTVPEHLSCLSLLDSIRVTVCCHDDGSKDKSWELLTQLRDDYEERNSQCHDRHDKRLQTRLLISNNKDGVARGAGYARNQAASLQPLQDDNLHFLCLLDSDDTMHETRIAEQVSAMLALEANERHRTILGCTFQRDPPDSTWHYAQWANGLTEERLMLERYREVTILQPTWMLTKSRFQYLGGYMEAPHPNETCAGVKDNVATNASNGVLRLVHSTYDTPQSLRLAEDLRFFHAHLHSNGLLRLHRTKTPLVTYRHQPGMSQSSQTPRKLLLQLRAYAFEQNVLCGDSLWRGPFVVWGAGRDGKDFVKALSEDARGRVACFVDVDDKKIDAGYYVNKELGMRVPIVHFSWLASEQGGGKEACFGRIDKSGPGSSGVTEVVRHEEKAAPKLKKRRLNRAIDLNLSLLPLLPVVVCVAMYRTNGALEANVKSIGRTEGKDLWHFS